MVFRCGKQQRNRISSPTWKAVNILSGPWWTMGPWWIKFSLPYVYWWMSSEDYEGHQAELPQYCEGHGLHRRNPRELCGPAAERQTKNRNDQKAPEKMGKMHENMGKRMEHEVWNQGISIFFHTHNWCSLILIDGQTSNCVSHWLGQLEFRLRSPNVLTLL